MEKIIFISGMSGTDKDTLLVKKILSNFEVIYFYYDTSLTEKIENYANQLKDFIDNLKLNPKEKVSIIAFSAGGIIASYYVKYLSSKKVNKIVTVCSPFRGSWIWRMYPKRIGVQQIKKDSNLLKNINNKNFPTSVKGLSIWCWIDPLVPGTSGKADNPRHTLFFLHWIIQLWIPIIYKIKKFLET